MDIANLAAFIAVAETLSFSLAAERLFLTQPAVSKRIAALEQSLNTKLFDRIGRTVQITEAGSALLPHAYHITNEIVDVQRKLSNLKTEVSGQLTIATSHHIGLRRLPSLLRYFTKKYPQVNLNIRFQDSEKAYEEVLQGRVELAIVTLAKKTLPPLKAVPIWQDHLEFVCALDSPLAQTKELTLTELSNYPAIVPSINTFTCDIIIDCFNKLGITPHIIMNTNYMETIKMLVSIGIAWGVLPKTMIDDSLTELIIPKINLVRQLGYITHTERTLSNPAYKLIHLIEQQCL